MKTIPYGHQWIKKDDVNAVVKTLKSDYLTQGPKIEEFEKAIASYVGTKYAVVFNSGTAALHSAYFACGLSQGDEFITSPITFVATSNAGLYLGAKPVFTDVEYSSGNMEVDSIKKYITKKTKLIVPVHFGGYPVDLESLGALEKKHKLFVVEDASHALGALYKGKKIGNCKYSDIAAFSFHPVKHITTGEGGAATTNDYDLYKKMCLFRSHGITKEKKYLKKESEGDWYYEMHVLGYNYRLTDIQASLGLSQLKKIDTFVKKRRYIAKQYDHAFKNNLFFDTLKEKEGHTSSYHLYPILLKKNLLNKKERIFKMLRERNVGVQVHYIPIPHQPYYQRMGFKKDKLKGYDFYTREISIPIFPLMTKKEIQYVVKTVFDVINSSNTYLCKESL